MTLGRENCAGALSGETREVSDVRSGESVLNQFFVFKFNLAELCSEKNI